MPYVERVTKAGNTIEIERYFTSRYKKKGISRGDKVKPTKEEQEKVNTRQAERKLRILINANYGYLRQQGYYTAVCYGWQPAAQLIEQYLLHSDELTKEQETVTMR